MLKILSRPSDPCRFILVSSDHITLSQSSFSHFLWVFSKCDLARRLDLLNCGRFFLYLDIILLLLSVRSIVLEEADIPEYDLSSLCISVDVEHLPIVANLEIYLSSCQLKTRGRPIIGVGMLFLLLFITFYTVARETPTIPGIFLEYFPLKANSLILVSIRLNILCVIVISFNTFCLSFKMKLNKL